MKCTLYLEIQHSEDQRIQFEDVKKQLEDSMANYEDTKLQLEDTKTMLEDSKANYEDTKLQLEDTKTMLEDSKTEISKFEKKLAEIVEYTKNPCKNCNGPTFCLDGNVVDCKPGDGTKIMALKDTYSNDEYGQHKVFADDIGTVDISEYDPFYDHPFNLPYVTWSKSGAEYCKDFSRFVYKCK